MRNLYIFILLLTIPTLVIVFMQPTMHKQLVITETNVTISQTTIQTVNKKTETINIVTESKSAEQKITKTTATTTKKTEQKPQKEIKMDVFSNYPVTEDAVSAKNYTTKAKPANNTKTNTQTVKKASTAQAKNVSNTKITPSTKQTTTKNVSDKTKKTEKIVQPKKEVKKPTPQEEIIAWNQWNANVRNVILSNLAQKRNSKEIKLISSNYSYSFTVTSGGKISNISISASVNNADTQKVKDSIKSIINSMSYSNVLKFPTGSQKQTYNVSSNISISSNVKKDSTAKATDFSEYEKVIK